AKVKEVVAQNRLQSEQLEKLQDEIGKKDKEMQHVKDELMACKNERLPQKKKKKKKKQLGDEKYLKWLNGMNVKEKQEMAENVQGQPREQLMIWLQSKWKKEMENEQLHHTLFAIHISLALHPPIADTW
ncbi:virulent strain associated lipoprotein, partial [Reticulomyxa filosa]